MLGLERNTAYILVPTDVALTEYFIWNYDDM